MAISSFPKGSELFDWRMSLYDNDTLVDLTGLTCSVTINFPTPLVKTTGLTRAATAPNLTVEWADGELNVTPGRYRATVTATSGGLDYKWTLPIQITDAD
jgi:hypothetical protein